MGMYDEFRSEHPKYPINGQTKSLHCLMDLYTLTAEGRLMRTVRDNWIEGDDVPPEDTNFQGTISVYSDGEDVEFTFVNGKIALVQVAGNL